jgi:hypothetical protein
MKIMAIAGNAEVNLYLLNMLGIEGYMISGSGTHHFSPIINIRSTYSGEMNQIRETLVQDQLVNPADLEDDIVAIRRFIMTVTV